MLQMAGHPPDGCCVEQVSVVFELATQSSIRFTDCQNQVEFRHAAIEWQWRQPQPL